MLAHKIIVLFVLILLSVQLLPSSKGDDYSYNDDTTQVSVSSDTNDDINGDNLSFTSLTLDQQIISIGRFCTKSKIIPGFPACILSVFYNKVPTPPPDNNFLLSC